MIADGADGDDGDDWDDGDDGDARIMLGGFVLGKKFD